MDTAVSARAWDLESAATTSEPYARLL